MRLPTLTLLSLAFIALPLYAASCTSGSPNLVNNCGFETGDFTSWTLSGHDSAPGYYGIDYGVDAADAQSGAYGAYLGGFGGVLDLSQSLTTNPGTIYTVSFWLAQSPTPIAPYLNLFSVNFGASSLLSITQLPNGSFAQYSFNALASSSSTPLSFGVRDDIGYFSLDDISVTPVAVPEPSAIGLGILAALLRIVFKPTRPAPLR